MLVELTLIEYDDGGSTYQGGFGEEGKGLL